MNRIRHKLDTSSHKPGFPTESIASGRQIVAGAAMVAMLMLLPAAAYALPACANPITACGCTINTSGTWTVANELSQTSTTDDCIDIKAKNVTLLTLAYAIDGPGGGANDAGIRILKSATGAVVDGYNGVGESEVFGFLNGIVIQANNAVAGDFEPIENYNAGIVATKANNLVLHDFGADNNSGDGVDITKCQNLFMIDWNAKGNSGDGFVIVKSNSASVSAFDTDGNNVTGFEFSQDKKFRVSDFESDNNGETGVQIYKSSNGKIGAFDSDGNGNYGLQAAGSKNLTINDFYTYSNSGTGTYIGCATSGGPIDNTCPGVPNSKKISVTAASSYENGGDGFAIDLKNTQNKISAVEADTNGGYDAEDDNKNCDKNLWQGNLFSSTNQACVK